LTHGGGGGAASVDGDEWLRLFLALPIPSPTADALGEWQHRHLGSGRIVAVADLHFTLAFLGRRPAAEVDAIAAELHAAARGARRPVLRPVGYRETRSVGMIVFEDVGGRATALAEDVQHRLEQLGVYRPEGRPWLPHATVLRFRSRPRLSPAVPDLGEVSPSEAAVYHSLLRPTGAQYEIVESVALGG
jgi:RNA 2',3'-cyclic 3'-phosphodiesterase